MSDGSSGGLPAALALDGIEGCPDVFGEYPRESKPNREAQHQKSFPSAKLHWHLSQDVLLLNRPFCL